MINGVSVYCVAVIWRCFRNNSFMFVKLSDLNMLYRLPFVVISEFIERFSLLFNTGKSNSDWKNQL